MSNDKPGLSDNMRKLAQSSSRSAELIAKADALDVATEAYFSEPQKIDFKKIVAKEIAYADARKLWCEITGQPLIP